MNYVRKKVIAWKARRLLASVGYRNPPVDATYVAQALGFKVLFVEFDNDAMAKDVLGLSDHETNTIYVNKLSTVVEKQVTIAGEIGKARLHPEWWKDVVAYRVATRANRSPTTEEAEAEWFALSLLAPRRWIASVEAYALPKELEKIFVLDPARITRARN